jgi:hypothetical protein
MKAHVAHLSKLVFALSVAVPSLSLIAAGGSTKNAPATAKTGDTNILAALAPVEIPPSVFIISANPKECRNPFFPQSAPATPLPTVKHSSADIAAFILNGITSPPKRTAMINGYTFEPGEEHEIKLPGGSKAMVKCEEIRDDSVIIVVGGVRRELRLRAGI